MTRFVLVFVVGFFSCSGDDTSFSSVADDGGDESLGYGDEPSTASSTQEPRPQQGQPAHLPSNAVSAGSFTAWTDPADPRPGQNYLIKIRVNYGDISFQSRDDLSGAVIGTDGYRADIRRARVDPYDHTTRVLVIPGASRLVSDEIQVQSGILGESQTLRIVF